MVAMLACNPAHRRISGWRMTRVQAAGIVAALANRHLLHDTGAAQQTLEDTEWSAPGGVVSSREVVTVLRDAGQLRLPQPVYGGVR